MKLRECELAVLGGADEVDIVLSLSSFLSGDYDAASDEIKAVRETIDKAAAASGRKVTLKVILETGIAAEARTHCHGLFPCHGGRRRLHKDFHG